MHMKDKVHNATISEFDQKGNLEITLHGPLAPYVMGMIQYVRRDEAVKVCSPRYDKMYDDDANIKSIFIVRCKLLRTDKARFEARVRLRNLCRQYICDVTGWPISIDHVSRLGSLDANTVLRDIECHSSAWARIIRSGHPDSLGQCTIGEILDMPRDEILKFEGIGLTSLDLIRQVFESVGHPTSF